MISKTKNILTALSVLLALCLPLELFAQNDNGEVFIDPNVGASTYRKTQVIDANQVETLFANWGIFGQRDKHPSGVWPKGTDHGHIHEMTLLCAGNVIGKNGKQYTIVSESYSEGYDTDGRKEFWWNPLPGYASETNPTPEVAISSDKATWPAAWPDKMDDADKGWPGAWNGYFGKNQMTADQEAYYVIDDFSNSEFQYYPFGETGSNINKRGLGLQVQTRLFEWQHSLAANQVFILFNISNASPTPYNGNIYMGAFADTHPGGLGSGNDQNGYSNKDDMVYAWAYQNKGVWDVYTDILPGYMAWKYLESPGMLDGVDNDNDGITDERRDNDAGALVTGSVGIYDDPKTHWSGDEDGDWDELSDDIGSDGIASTDLNYTGPDANGTEGNGRPDQGEPNFGILDNDESDQIGLTSFWEPLYSEFSEVGVKNDEELWKYIQPGFQVVDNENVANYLWIFASGPFNLNSRATERFSTCFIFGQDQSVIFKRAATSQRIYDNDYSFAKPPELPTITAVPGDKKVTLYWDNFSERSYDPIYGRDFEGYRIYRGTDAQLTEAQQITDANGNVVYMKPIAQFDLVDDIKGIFPIALGAEDDPSGSYGIHYFMGEDTGLKYFYEDDELINGYTYFYVVVGYDKGYYTGMDDRNLAQMTPSESSWYITYTGGKVTSLSQNAVVVTPNALATNYLPGYVNNTDSAGAILKNENTHTAGKASISILNPEAIPENNEYEVTFQDQLTTNLETQTISYSVRNATTDEYLLKNYDVPFVPLDTNNIFESGWVSAPFDGMYLTFKNGVPNDVKTSAMSRWNKEYYERDSATIMNTSVTKSSLFTPAINATIEITSEIADTPYTIVGAKQTPVYYKIYNTYTKEKIRFSTGNDKDGILNVGDRITLLGYNGKAYSRMWSLSFSLPSGQATGRAPIAGDKFSMVVDLPFTANDTLRFTTVASKAAQGNGESMNNIKVVPNPYVVAAAWEKSTTISGRGERRIDFIHLPSKCTIRIFTQNGVLLKTIEHNGVLTDGTASWDLTTRDGLEVAFGIYVYHIEAPGIGKKIGTFAIIN
jgi:hypothetical protein